MYVTFAVLAYQFGGTTLDMQKKKYYIQLESSIFSIYLFAKTIINRKDFQAEENTQRYTEL